MCKLNIIVRQYSLKGFLIIIWLRFAFYGISSSFYLLIALRFAVLGVSLHVLLVLVLNRLGVCLYVFVGCLCPSLHALWFGSVCFFAFGLLYFWVFVFYHMFWNFWLFRYMFCLPYIFSIGCFFVCFACF